MIDSKRKTPVTSVVLDPAVGVVLDAGAAAGEHNDETQVARRHLPIRHLSLCGGPLPFPVLNPDQGVAI